MKLFTVSVSEPVDGVTRTYNTYVQNENGEYAVTGKIHSVLFYELSSAKKFIKEHMDIYVGSSITKVYSNGDTVNCGEIKMRGSNKHFIANTRMTKSNY